MVDVEQSLELTPRPTSPRTARRFVGRVLERAVPRDVTEAGELLTSELVTNALLYARGRIEVRVRLEEEAVRVAVRDEHPAPLPRWAPPTEVATSGRGLALVESLASSWGIEPVDEVGKEIWFELPR